MTNLTDLEHAVLARLVAGKHPLLLRLRDQLEKCQVSRRELTGAGFYAYLDVGDAAPAGNVSVRFGDVIADIEGMSHGAGFMLYIEHGRLSMLEGYGYDDPWPSMIADFTVKYDTGGERNWTAFGKWLPESGDTADQ